MKLFGQKIKIFSAAEWDRIQGVLEQSGKEVVTETKSNAAEFVETIRKQYPDIEAAITKGIIDLRSETMSGQDKAMKVTMDVIAIAPAVLKAVPGIKDALMAAVTAFFVDEVSDFKNAAVKMIKNL